VIDYVVQMWDNNEQKYRRLTYDEFEQEGVQQYLNRKKREEEKHTIGSVIQRYAMGLSWNAGQVQKKLTSGRVQGVNVHHLAKFRGGRRQPVRA